MTTSEVYIEVTYDDGTIARWVVPAGDQRLDALEQLLGQPDTLVT